ncbi:VOC family protein [Ktedonobacter racemifer]|uniref:Glyoxalase/bleomycin resistance protein/dioxygenase n=1 Tax=Ktedonobacter racemifer DSM 44963 TaxID=485913 RepID=D6U7I6_KTERA|nr:VOC family protein [Ktedonobacter racemifer]EFH79847.1 Glyoxalase/bleomycin resistance protein/dioxygenase [Ktedonobacter racemifer DSM 44963]
MASLYKYGRLAIAAINFNEMKEFYSKILQEEPIRHIKDVYVEFQLPELRIGLFKPRPDNRPEFMHDTRSTASIVLEVIDINDAANHFRSVGCSPGKIIDTFHGKEFYAYDPAQNRLIVHQEK